MKNLFLEAHNYDGRINMDVFSNVEKSITRNELKEKYPSEKFSILEKSQVNDFIAKVYETSGGEIKKGGFNDTPEIKDLLSKAEKQLSSLKKVKVRQQDSYVDVYILQKSEDERTGFKKGQESDIKKGAATALRYEGAGINFEKKGSDLKIAISNSIDRMESKCGEMVTKMNDCLNDCEWNPTESCSEMHYGDDGVLMNCPYKFFKYQETWFDNDNGAIMQDDKHAYNKCGTEDQATKHSEYNQCLRNYLDCLCEIKILKVYENNLVDSRMYELTANQMLALNL